MTDQEIIDRIRILLGLIPVEALPDMVIEMYLGIWKAHFDYINHPERLPLIIYNTLVSCVRWLIVQEVASGESSVTDRLEKIGDETIQVKGGSSYKDWQDFLDWLLLNPTYVDPTLNSVSGMIIIGGTRRDEVARVENHPNSYDTYSVKGILPRCDPRGRSGPYGRGYPSPFQLR